jgi:hypothetical protein
MIFLGKFLNIYNTILNPFVTIPLLPFSTSSNDSSEHPHPVSPVVVYNNPQEERQANLGKVISLTTRAKIGKRLSKAVYLYVSSTLGDCYLLFCARNSKIEGVAISLISRCSTQGRPFKGFIVTYIPLR